MRLKSISLERMPQFWFYVNVTVTIQTPSEAPVIAPRHVSGGGGKVGTLTITWEVMKICHNENMALQYTGILELQN